MIKQDYKYMFSLGVIAFIFYAFFANVLAITNPVEVNYALTAKEMLAHHSYISPIIFGHPWYDKPPLTYWMLILSFKIFGITNFAARFPAILTSSLTVMAMFAATKILTGRLKTAFWASVTLVTSFEFWYIGHAVVTDGYLLLASLGIFIFSYLAFTKENCKYMILAYVSAAFAVLAKGPVGIILPGLVLIIFLLIRRHKKDWIILFNPIGIILFFAIAAPWYFAMYQIHGEAFITGFLGLHNFVRSTVAEHPEQDVWYYYLLLTPIYLLPWTGFTITEWVHDYKTKRFKTDSLRQFQWLWLITIVLFYTIVATKYITYTYIALIPLIMMTAEAIVRLSEKPKSLCLQWIVSFTALLALNLLLMVAAIWEPHINPSLMIMTTIISLVISLASIKLVSIRHFNAIVAMLAVMVFLALPATIIPVVNIRSAQIYSQEVESLHPQQIYFFYDYDTSYSYYTGHTPIRIIDSRKVHYDIWDKGKDVMPTLELSQLEGPNTIGKNVLIIVPKSRLKHFLESPISKSFKEFDTYDRYIFYVNYNPQNADSLSTKPI